MSDFQHRDGSFICFKNDKDGNESRPDLTGEGKDPAGNLVSIALWIKTGKNGKFITGTIQPKNAGQAQSQPKTEAKSPGKSGFDDLEDDKPW